MSDGINDGWPLASKPDEAMTPAEWRKLLGAHVRIGLAKDAEVARLRAEVERLTRAWDKERAEHENDIRCGERRLMRAEAARDAALRERDDWKEKCREANAHRSRVWGQLQRTSADMAGRMAALKEALETEQAQHVLTTRGHINASKWAFAQMEESAALAKRLEDVTGALRTMLAVA